jgi:hypothetical protein
MWEQICMNQPSSIDPVLAFDAAGQRVCARELFFLLASWLVIVLALASLAAQNLSAPGLYYDESIAAGLAKDFLQNKLRGVHLPGYWPSVLFGRPFPTMIQDYCGALASWLLIPTFKVFGATLPVLRSATFSWDMAALLLFMLWIWRWLGLAVALLAGALLASDPAFFFLGLLDWGFAVPSFLCRAAGLCLVLVWWENGRNRYVFLAAACFGLGFFNKADFSVFIAGLAAAAAIVYARPLWGRLRAWRSLLPLAFLGFGLGAFPIIHYMPHILHDATTGVTAAPAEFSEKLHTMLTMYDGSYFFRLMEVGGVFRKMFAAPSSVWSPFGVAVLCSSLVLAVEATVRRSVEFTRAARFLLVSALLVTLGVFIVPGAVRLHHAVLVVPLPHLIVATAVVVVWRRMPADAIAGGVLRGLLTIALLVVLFGQGRALQMTRHTIRISGGRGYWSASMDEFCQEIKGRSNLTIASVDWGFNEQVLFLTDEPRAVEPFWQFKPGFMPPRLRQAANVIYLAHPPDYSVFGFDHFYLDEARAAPTNFEIKPWRDRQGHIDFYSIAFRQQRPSGAGQPIQGNQ